MSFPRLSFFAFVLVHACFLFLHSSPVYCNEEEDDLFQGLNNFRESLNLTDLRKNEKAGCIADEISDELEGQACSSAAGYNIKPGNGDQFPSFGKLLTKCDIDNSTTSDGIILPVCVANLDPDLVLNNYTHSDFAQYLNDSKYTGVGVGSKDDWMIVVLTTDSPNGSFTGASASSPRSRHGSLHCFVVGIVLGFAMINQGLV